MSNTLSVIIPVYNVENYLKQCVDSILNQTYKELEVFLIDDGSTDESSKICDEYSLIDKRVRVYHKENSGQSGARNMALDMATGDFVTFVDSDDYLAPDMYETLMSNLQKYEADISCCSCYMVTDGIVNAEKKSYDQQISIYEKKDEIFSNIFGRPSLLRPEIWNKVYKREIIGNVRFKERQVHQDVYFDRMVFNQAPKVVFFNSPLYYYRVNRPGNTNSKPFNENRLPVLDEFEGLANELREDNHIYSAEQVEVFAMEMIIIFCNNAPAEIKKKLHSRYLKFYKKLSCKTLIRVPKLIVFRIAPNMLGLISSMSSLLRR